MIKYLMSKCKPVPKYSEYKVKKDIATHMESLVYTASKKVENIQLPNFHKFFRGFTDIFSKNVLKILHIKT